MKRAALIAIVLMAIPLAALWAQSDPAYPPADPPASDQPANDPYAIPSDPQAAPPPSAEPTRHDAAIDPDAVNDPDAAGNELPATAGHGPLILLMGLLAIGMFLVLKVFRRRSVDVS